MKLLIMDIGLVLMLLLLIIVQPAYCQEDSIRPKIRKNTIRMNITNPMIFGKSYILNYERIVRPNQSLAIGVGSFSLPKIGSLDLGSAYQISSSADNGGFNFSAEYRF